MQNVRYFFARKLCARKICQAKWNNRIFYIYLAYSHGMYGRKYQLKITVHLEIIAIIANENLDANRLIALALPEPGIDKAWRVVG